MSTHGDPGQRVETTLARTRDLVQSVPYVIPATSNGPTVSTRQVQPLSIDDDMAIWVGTSPRSRKVAEITDTAQATVAVEHFDAFAYASIACDAQIVVDGEERGHRWIEELRPFFPAGPGGDDFVLIRLTPHSIELMDFSLDITPDPYGLVPAVTRRIDGEWRPASHPRGA